MELNWTNLNAIILDTLLDDRKDQTVINELEAQVAKDPRDVEAVRALAAGHGVVIVETAVQNVAFNKERLVAHRDDVRSMLEQLGDSFFESKGGGDSLINMVVRRDGVQWGEQWQADFLYALGAGLEECWHSVPRSGWNLLPGGMPYITVKG